MAKRYKLSKAMRRFIAMLTDNARQYRWCIVDSAIRGFAPELRGGKCSTPDEKSFCPITACYPVGLMSGAVDFATRFGLTRAEGYAIMAAADNPLSDLPRPSRRYYVVKTLRPLLLKAVGLPPEEPTA